jgi:hypothetical protein
MRVGTGWDFLKIPFSERHAEALKSFSEANILMSSVVSSFAWIATKTIEV